MTEPTSRWDAFAPWELAALDEFFRSFARERQYNADIQKMGEEIAAAMRRRAIEPYVPVDQKPTTQMS